MATNAQIALCLQAFDQWGQTAQLMIAMEELAELAVAISHYTRGRPDPANAQRNLAEEIADVELVCTSLRQLIGAWDVDAIKRAKWARLEARLAQDTERGSAPDTPGEP